ncbi:MAG TPA: hypothetical protein VMW56_31660 [Candidatus Margulisiibacteriota bacterium]|nr:hypothetical protein [Candidatus Margulisiibacteriota bacterium]
MPAEVVALPEGTVTVLSTDLVGCTLLNQRLGDEAATALERDIAELARAPIEKQRGVMIAYAGDGLMVVADASWGYGFAIASPTKWKYYDGSLQPLGTLCHPGAGGAVLWIDRAHELVGAYFEVGTHVTASMDHLVNCDLFQNMTTAAVED